MIERFQEQWDKREYESFSATHPNSGGIFRGENGTKSECLSKSLSDLILNLFFGVFEMVERLPLEGAVLV